MDMLFGTDLSCVSYDIEDIWKNDNLNFQIYKEMELFYAPLLISSSILSIMIFQQLFLSSLRILKLREDRPRN